MQHSKFFAKKIVNLEALQRGGPVLDPADQLTEGDGALCRCAVDRGHDGQTRGSVLKVC